MTNAIKKLITEAVKTLLKEYRLETNMVPQGIRAWVDRTIGQRVSKYELEQRGELEIGMPVYEADREEYQMFRLTDGGDAVPVEGVSFYRAGNEGDGVPVLGPRIGGKAVIPSGHVLVMTSRMFKMATLYTAGDAMKMMMPAPSDQEQLSDMELLALYQAKGLKSAYRHKFKPEIYDRLISLGLMASNKSVTNKGRNFLETPQAIERLGGKFSSSKLDHLIKGGWLREGITPEARAEAVAFAKEMKRYIASKYGVDKLSVQIGKSVNPDPYIMVAGKGDVRTLPDQLRRDCLTLVYGPENADKHSMGNISQTYITMHWSQWKKLIGTA